MNTKPSEIDTLREKLLDIETHVIRIETINNLFAAYAAENSPEGSIISELILKELDEIFSLLRIKDNAV